MLPAVVIAGFFLAKGKQYYLVCVIMIITAMAPFFASLERKKLQVRELVVTASVVAAAVASRAAFFFMPQAKPMCAVLIVAAIAFGAEFGFISGALSMLLSNFIFGQGMWTPFQMLGMGMTVFLCAVIFRSFKIKNTVVLGVISGVVCFVVYGLIVDLSSVLMMTASFDFKSIFSIYLSGMPFNAIHAVTTAVLVALIQPAAGESLQRVKTKYGLFGEKK